MCEERDKKIVLTKDGCEMGASGRSKKLRHYDVVEATISLRRLDGYPTREDVERFNGMRLRFVCAGPADCDNSDRYSGEMAMMPMDGTWLFGWIASGDLVDISRPT